MVVRLARATSKRPMTRTCRATSCRSRRRSREPSCPVNADDTDFVKAGQTLVTLDRADAEVALAQAQAALAQTVREVRSLYTANATWSANIAQREADVDARAGPTSAGPRTILRRRKSLSRTGAVSGEELNHAQDARQQRQRRACRSAEAALTAARQQLATSQSLTEGTTVEKHPNVERAAAKVREAYLAYARTVLPAPVSGYVAKRTVQVGQRVAPGAPLMSIIPLDQVWVDANFKEVQLRKMRIGQPVTLTADAYGTGSRISRQARRPGRGHRQRVRIAAGAKRDRQLDQGRAARSRSHRTRPQGACRSSVARGPVDGSGGGRRQHPGQDARRGDADRGRLHDRRLQSRHRGRRRAGAQDDRRQSRTADAVDATAASASVAKAAASAVARRSSRTDGPRISAKAASTPQL